MCDFKGARDCVLGERAILIQFDISLLKCGETLSWARENELVGGGEGKGGLERQPWLCGGRRQDWRSSTPFITAAPQ